MKKRIWNSIIALGLCGIIIFNFTGCHSNKISANAKNLTEDYSRKATDEGEVTEEFKKAFANFSFSLMASELKVNESRKENKLMSPLSAIIALAMLANGAKGETLDELETLFGMDINSLNKSLYAYTKSLYSASDCKVNLADSIWNKNDGQFIVNEDFLQTIADWYDAEVYNAPFDKETAKDINNWCSQKTDGLINEVIKSESLINARMILINSILFDAAWSRPYEDYQIEKNKKFYNYNGSESDVTMLCSTETYLKGTNYCGMQKFYSGGQYSMVAILPDEGLDAYDFMAGLNAEKWSEILENYAGKAEVELPEFKYEADINLIPVLQNLGVKDIFAAPDLTGLGTYKDGSSTRVGAVIQKTYIEVDKKGTKAAAVTIIEMTDSCAPMETDKIVLNRPFVYAIIDNNTGLPLFVGVMAWAK